MKFVFLFVSSFIILPAVHAQTGSWTVKLNGKNLTSTSREDEKKNCKKLSPADWNHTGKLEISFKEDDPRAWIRSFIFYDEQDQEIFRADSTTTCTVVLEKLRKDFNGKKSMIIYTVIAPTDPSIAIRVRRVHLYSFILP